MSARRGETTNVHPGTSVAGSWYVSDLPPPEKSRAYKSSTGGREVGEMTCGHDAYDIPSVHARITDTVIPGPIHLWSGIRRSTYPSCANRKLLIPNTHCICPFNASDHSNLPEYPFTPPSPPRPPDFFFSDPL